METGAALQRWQRAVDGKLLEDTKIMNGDDRDDIRIGGLGRVRAPDAADATSGVEGAGSIASTQSVAATGEATAVSAAQQVTEALSSGAIDAAQAKALLIDEIVRAQMPPGTDPAVLEELRAEITDLLADDPTLESLLRP